MQKIVIRLISSISRSTNMVVLVHGGAGTKACDKSHSRHMDSVKCAAILAYRTLEETDSPLDAVETAICFMEDNEEFNAGKGSVINSDGDVEMDAGIMDSELNCGTCTIVQNVKNPIRLARSIMDNTNHVMLGGCAAEDFAKKMKLDMVEPGAMITPKRLDDLNKMRSGALADCSQLGTVGAVALNACGKLAAGSSTGGCTGKMRGRCSDTSVIGAGIYCNPFGAVSVTGHGESIMKFCIAYEILQRIQDGYCAQTATCQTLKSMTERLRNTAGAITLTKKGDIGIGFTSTGMSWAYVQGNKIHFGMKPDDHSIKRLRL